MEVLLQGIPLDSVSTSRTINATAAMLLLLYQLVAERQGCLPERITGTVQNDILKEYAARGTYIFPPQPSMRLTTDLFAYCRRHLPNWNTISISGYHIREAGATAAEEVAFTLSDAIAYVEAALAAGLEVDQFAPRLSFFFACHMDFFEEAAKFRAARRMWARIMRDRFGAQDKRSQALRFHTQTGGVTLTFQQRVETGDRVIVGQNRFTATAEAPVEIMRIEPRGEEEQRQRVAKVRGERDAGAAERCLDRLGEEALGTGNLLPPLREALAAY